MRPGLAVPGPRLHHHLLHVAVGVEELADTVGNIVLEICIFINVPICLLCCRASNEPSRRLKVKFYNPPISNDLCLSVPILCLWVNTCLA